MLKSREFLSEKSRGIVGGGGGLSSLALVILGPVPRILFQQGTDLVNKLALLLNKCWFTQDSWDKPKNDECWGRGLGTFSQSGRSMIEMLGVLAIIGVLSVGGIAGYSKAMEMYKINKIIEEYSYLISGLIEQKSNVVASHTFGGLADVVVAMNLVPETWQETGGTINNSPASLIDPYGNNINVFTREEDNGERIVIDFYLGGLGDDKQSLSFSKKFCMSLMQNTIQPLAPALYYSRLAHIWNDKHIYYGSQFCGAGRTCLKDLSLPELKEICDSCSGRACGIVLEL